MLFVFTSAHTSIGVFLTASCATMALQTIIDTVSLNVNVNDI